MLSCWHPCPVSRPNFDALKLRLEDLLAETQSYIDLTIEVSGDYFHSDSTTGYDIVAVAYYIVSAVL